MKMTILGLMTLGLTVASVTANAESEMRGRDVSIHATQPVENSMREDFFDRRFAGEVVTRGDREASSRAIVASKQGASPRGAAVAAPEIDPASAVSGLTLLLGGMAVLLGRRRPAV
jgi:hypothetical protein